MRYDAAFAAEMAYCEDKAIPHSQFLSWDPSDRAKVIAFRLERAAVCTRCGSADWQWEADPFAFEAEVIQCPGCLRLDAKRDEMDATDFSKTVVLTPRLAAERNRRKVAQPAVSPVEARRRAREEARE